MLLTKESKVNITHRNKKYYSNKGYRFDVGDTILVKVEDLPISSRSVVEVECQGCKEIKEMQWQTYLVNINNTEIQDYYCIHCQGIKRKMLADTRQSKGLLTRHDDYYWSFEENRIKELNLYIKKHGNIHNIKDNDFPLYGAILEYDDSIISLTKKMSLNLDDIMQHKPYGYYDNLDNIINEIEVYIENNGRFPTQNEMFNDIGIVNSHIYKHFENVEQLKDYINYIDDNDLIDNRGDRNRSYLELYVANFLIAYGFKDVYKREQYPFKKFDSNITYRSDFTFYLEDDKEIHIEVWGIDLDKHSKRFKPYKEKMQIKKKLYDKHSDDLILISIFPKDLYGSYDKINKNLYKIFSPYLKMEFKEVEYNALISSKDLKDYELLEEIMKYSNDINFLPTRDELKVDSHGRRLIHIIDSKYGGLLYFVNKFNKVMRHKKNNYWTDANVFECFDYMLDKYGEILSSSKYREYKDINVIGVYNYIQKNGGIIFYKLKYIDNCIGNNKITSQSMIEFLECAKNGYINGVRKTDILQHKELIDKIYNRYKNQKELRTA